MKIIKSILIAVLFLFVTTSTKAQNFSNTVMDFDGNVYKTIKIGSQVWMAENLRTTHYSDGKLVQYKDYNNDTTNVKVYGRLYSWNAAMRNSAASNTNPSNVQGIAPAGWHLPSRAEWQQLADYLGGNECCRR